MSSITDDQIRWRILNILVEEGEKSSSTWGVHKSIIQDLLRIPNKNLDFNITFLVQNGLVKVVRVHSADWLWAKITQVGKDVILNSERYLERFSFVKYNKLQD